MAVPCTMEHYLWQCLGTMEHRSCGSALHNGALPGHNGTLQLWQCPAQWSIAAVAVPGHNGALPMAVPGHNGAFPVAVPGHNGTLPMA